MCPCKSTLLKKFLTLELWHKATALHHCITSFKNRTSTGAPHCNGEQITSKHTHKLLCLNCQLKTHVFIPAFWHWDRGPCGFEQLQLWPNKDFTHIREDVPVDGAGDIIGFVVCPTRSSADKLEINKYYAQPAAISKAQPCFEGKDLT